MGGGGQEIANELYLTRYQGASFRCKRKLQTCCLSNHHLPTWSHNPLGPENSICVMSYDRHHQTREFEAHMMPTLLKKTILPYPQKQHPKDHHLFKQIIWKQNKIQGLVPICNLKPIQNEKCSIYLTFFKVDNTGNTVKMFKFPAPSQKKTYFDWLIKTFKYAKELGMTLNPLILWPQRWHAVAVAPHETHRANPPTIWNFC